jgi:hypothetical protein
MEAFSIAKLWRPLSNAIGFIMFRGDDIAIP